MKIFNTHFFPSDMLSKVGSRYAMFLFTGEVPTSVDSIDFNTLSLDELLAESSSVIDVSAISSGDLLVFKNNAMLRAKPGYKFDLDKDRFRITPKSVLASAGLVFSKSMSNVAELLSAERGSVYAGRPSAGEYLEYEFTGDVTIDYMELSHHTTSNYSVDDYRVEYFFGGEWLQGEDIRIVRNSVSSGKAEVNLTQSYTCSKIRFVATEVTASNTYIGGLSFYGTEEPLIDQSIVAPYSWFLMVSLTDTFDGTEIPILIGDAGGPNSNKEVALNVYEEEHGAEVKLMNFKFKSAPMEAV